MLLMKYIIVSKDNIDKVYSIIQYLPLEIFTWLASEGDKSKQLYESLDFDELLRVYIDLVKEILIQDAPDYYYTAILEQLEELREEKKKNDSN